MPSAAPTSARGHGQPAEVADARGSPSSPGCWPRRALVRAEQSAWARRPSPRPSSTAPPRSRSPARLDRGLSCGRRAARRVSGTASQDRGRRTAATATMVAVRRRGSMNSPVAGKGRNEPVRARVIVARSGAGKSASPGTRAAGAAPPALQEQRRRTRGSRRARTPASSTGTTPTPGWTTLLAIEQPLPRRQRQGAGAADRRTIAAATVLDDGTGLFLAKGIFAQEIVPVCQDRGHLGGVLHPPHRVVTFWRRLHPASASTASHPSPLRRAGPAARPATRRHPAVDLGCGRFSPEEAAAAVSAQHGRRSSADA